VFDIARKLKRWALRLHMARPRTQLERQFRLYNRKYFRNKLPKDTILGWRRMRSLMGYQQGNKIVLSKSYRRTDALWKFTLLHEMVHLKLDGIPCADHGPLFQAEMLRLANLGAFKGLW
jgi:Zn-dependent peptidase ImmA (M78 family)